MTREEVLKGVVHVINHIMSCETDWCRRDDIDEEDVERFHIKFPTDNYHYLLKIRFALERYFRLGCDQLKDEWLDGKISDLVDKIYDYVK